MAKRINRLNDEKVRTAKPKHTDRVTHLYDGGGLVLRIQPSGSKAWLFAFGLDTKTRQMGLGKYPMISLTVARQLRDEAYAQLVRGIDPIAERQRVKDSQRQQQAEQALADADRKNTFAACAEDWFAVKQRSGKWRSKRTERQVHDVLFGYCCPHLGDLPVSTITVKHMQDLLTAVALHGKTDRNGKPTANSRGSASMASLVKIYAVNVLEHGGSDINWRVKLKYYGHVPKAKKRPKFSPEELQAFFADLMPFSHLQPTRAIKLLALTCVRGNELLGASWSEFDLDAATWIVPESRMKMKQAHTVPLSQQAVELFREQFAITGNGRSGLVWPSITRHSGANVKDPSRTIVLETLNGIINRAGWNGPKCTRAKRLSAHCFRHSFSSTCHELELASHETIEKCLAHETGNAVSAAYDQSERIPQRRYLMQKYADLVAPVQEEQPQPAEFCGPIQLAA